MAIQQDLLFTGQVETENANRPHTYGRLVPENFSPFAKNPVIAKFFTQLGHVDELGSGILNVNKYLPFYAPGKVPVFEEGDVFKMTIPSELNDAVNEGLTEGATKRINKELNNIISDALNEGVKKELIKVVSILHEKPGLKAAEIAEGIGKAKSTIEKYLRLLRNTQTVEFRGTPKTGGYFLTSKFNSKISK